MVSIKHTCLLCLRAFVIKNILFLSAGYELSPHAAANFTRKNLADSLRTAVSLSSVKGLLGVAYN